MCQYFIRWWNARFLSVWYSVETDEVKSKGCDNNVRPPGDLGAVDYFRHLRCVVTEELPRSIFASPPLGPMGPPRGVPGRGPPPMRPPHDTGRMKYNEPRPPYNNHGKLYMAVCFFP